MTNVNRVSRPNDKTTHEENHCEKETGGHEDRKEE